MSLYASLPPQRRRAALKVIDRSYRRARNRKIVRLYAEGMRQKDIAARFRLTESAVGKIRRGVMGGDDTADLRAMLRAREDGVK